MFLLVLKSIFQKVWEFFKKYWMYIAPVILIAIMYFQNSRKTDSLIKMIDDIKVSHDAEIKAIQEAHQQEINELEINEKIFEQRMITVEKQFEDAKQKLNDEKKAEIQDLLKKYGDDPDELARQLSDIAGFSVYVPTEG